ncbi:MAG: hypothetical protein E7577_01840 [Ruminococcaceae bacterium]|nr:hypothetical protein [Oscillospiraceae bacterium]
MKKIISFLLATTMLLGMFSIGTFAETPLTLDMKAVEGASVRIGDVAGIRFQTMINKAELDAIVTANGASNVEIGTLITPTQYVKGAGAFTMEALDAYKAFKGFENEAYVKVKATYANPFDTETVDGTEYYVYAGSLENILDANVMLSFSGIGYVKIGDEVVYAEYNEADSSRTVGYVAYRAYLANDENLGTDGKNLIDDFSNKFLTAKLGEGAPDISTIRYFENYDDMADTADFADATTFLGWKDNFVYGSGGAGYVYGKDVKAKYEGGKLVFKTTNTAREGHTTEKEFIASNTLNAQTQDMAHSLLTIPGLDNTTLYADGNHTFVMQFDMKITSFEGDCAVGLAYCDKDTNLSRGRFVAASDVSWMFCSEVANTTAWYKKPGSIAAYCDPDAAVVRVQFILNKDMTVQQMSLNGTVINATYANADQVSGNFDIGLYFLKVGTVEIDNLLVYSYGDGGYLQQD